jgi:hypothetical protein
LFIYVFRAFQSSWEQGKLPVLLQFSLSYFVFKNENVKVKVKYGFVLYLDLPFVILIAQTENFRIFFIGKGSFKKDLVV